MNTETLNKLGHFKTSLNQIRYEFAKNSSGQFQQDDYPYHITKFSGIKSHCDDCAGSPSTRRNCRVTNCPFWPYRLGKNPFHAGNGQKARGVALDA